MGPYGQDGKLPSPVGRAMRPLWILPLLCTAAGAGAVDFHSMQVSHTGDVYRMEADVHLAAPPAQVFQVLTDYEHLTRISASVVKSSVTQRFDGGALVYTDTRICALLICRHLRELQKLTEMPPLDLMSVVVPQTGDNVKVGSGSVHLEAEGDGTRLVWQMSVQPDFWIPPLIGPALVSRSLRAEATRSAEGIERLARERAKLVPLDDARAHEDEKPQDDDGPPH